MTWARLRTTAIVCACVLAIVALAPAVVVEPIQNAVAQVRWNAYKTDQAEATALSSETMVETVTSAKRAK